MRFLKGSAWDIISRKGSSTPATLQNSFQMIYSDAATPFQDLETLKTVHAQ